MNKEILKRYLGNRASEEEKYLIKEWLREPGNEKEVLEFIESSYGLEDENVPVGPFEILLEKINGKRTWRTKVISLYKDKRFWVACAACVVFMIIGSWAGYRFNSNSNGSNAWITNVSQGGKGQYAKLTMSDGSDVYLAENSKISFSGEMSVHRVVYLEGEAYFDLHNDSKTLTIKTRDLVTTTKGSKLNISAFLKDSIVTVIVEKGKAEVQKNNEVYPLLNLRIPGKDSLAEKGKTNMPKTIPWTKLSPAITVKQNEQVTYDKNTKATDVSKLKPGTMPLLKLLPSNAFREDSNPQTFDNKIKSDSTSK